MSKTIGIKLLTTAAILLATAAVSQATLIGNSETTKPRAPVAGDQPRAIVGSDIGSLAPQSQKFDLDDVSVALRAELQDCAASDLCNGSSILKLKDLDAGKRQITAASTPMMTSVTTTLEKYVADFTWSAPMSQNRTYVVIPLEGSQSDERVRNSEVSFSSAATLALVGTALLGLGLAGRRSKHRHRSTKTHSRIRRT